jgi:hypothetical protein
MAPNGDEHYQRQLGEVLRTVDPAALRAFLLEQAARYGDDRQVAAVRDLDEPELERLLHRMILTRNDLPNLHPASRAWLAERGEAVPAAQTRSRPRNGAGARARGNRDDAPTRGPRGRGTARG